MIEWHDPSKSLPDDGVECLLLLRDKNGLSTVGVFFGPIRWSAKEGAWLDNFRDPDAGTILRPEHVGYWTLWDRWNPIAPPEELLRVHIRTGGCQ